MSRFYVNSIIVPFNENFSDEKFERAKSLEESPKRKRSIRKISAKSYRRRISILSLYHYFCDNEWIERMEKSDEIINVVRLESLILQNFCNNKFERAEYRKENVVQFEKFWFRKNFCEILPQKNLNYYKNFCNKE